jgi:hypothetical protein
MVISLAGRLMAADVMAADLAGLRFLGERAGRVFEVVFLFMGSQYRSCFCAMQQGFS